MKSELKVRTSRVQPRMSTSRCIIITFLVLVNSVTYLILASLTPFSASSLLHGAILKSPSSATSKNREDRKYWIYNKVYSSIDQSPRCMQAHICDGLVSNASCGEDGVGCITSPGMRQDMIKQAMKGSWDSYRQHAWGHDELHVQGDGNLSHRDWQNQGITIIDAMSTLLLMNMTEEYQLARDWAVQPDRFTNLGHASVFETNIRVVGGLLSAYTLNGSTDSALLLKAQQVADSLLPSFSSAGGMPQSFYAGGRTDLAEAGTYSLEMTTLSHITGNQTYANASNRFWDQLDKLPSCDGLYCTWFDPSTMTCQDHSLSFGASADSMYEYMLKQWVLSNKQEQDMLERYKRAMVGMRRHLIRKVKPCKPSVTPSGDTPSVTSTTDTGGTYNTVQSRSMLRASLARQSLWHDPFWIVSEGTQTGTCSLPTQSLVRNTAHSTTERQAITQPQSDAPVGSHDSNDYHADGNPDDDDDDSADLQEAAEPAVDVQLRLQHLSCFLPGMLALGHMHGVRTAARHASVAALVRSHIYPGHPIQAQVLDDLHLAANLMRGCYELYRNSETGVAGDDAYWEETEEAGVKCHKLKYKSTDSFLRPEVVESLFYLWRATHDPVYRDWGWQIFRSHYVYSRLPSGAYSTLMAATTGQHHHGDRQESFWLAETLKYFYLLFSDDPALLPLDKWVLNTEAHPLPIWEAEKGVTMATA